MSETTGCPTIKYGTEGSIGRDVDLFEAFYLEHFREEALARFVKRSRKNAFRCALAAFAFACFFPVPMIIDSTPVFAKILLAMGLLPLGVGVYFLNRYRSAQARCERDFEELMASEFHASRTSTKRIFEIVFGEEDVRVFFGVRSGVHQKRSKAYADISRIVVTNDLLFIKGLTWLCRFQMDDTAFNAVADLLRERCGAAFVDERTAIGTHGASPAPEERGADAPAN